MKKATQWKIVGLLAIQSSFFTLSTAQNKTESAVSKKEIPSWLDHQIQQDSNSILEVVLETDMKQLMKGKMSEQYQPAVFSYTDKDGSTKRYEVEIKARGKTRKQLCQHPPIKVKFKKSVLEAEGFGPYNEMKVVWECSESSNAEQYIFREFMTYQLYAMLTGASFRTKLASIRITDPKNPDRKIDKMGFFVEDEDQVANRNDGKMTEEAPKDIKLLMRQPYLIFGVFQYMIGNTDWSVGNSHNMRFIKLSSGASSLIPVPYDFDYSGLVNTHYAAPDPNLGIPTVRDRIYRGSTGTETEFTLVRQKFIDVKPKMLAYAQSFPHLDKSSRTDFVKYLNEFFMILNDPKQFYRAINP